MHSLIGVLASVAGSGLGLLNFPGSLVLHFLQAGINCQKKENQERERICQDFMEMVLH